MAKREVSYDYFWNSKGDRYYSADSMGDWLRPFFSNGVFNGQLQVTANDDMSVTIAEGYGYINGKHRHFLTPTILDLETASGTLNRIDSVMLRRDDTERQISLLIVKGGNASTPTAPQPTRGVAIYELKLADIYVAAGAVKITQAEITDMRMNADVCGWVAATVKEIDFSQMQNQFESYFANYKTEIADEFDEYLTEIERLKGEGKLSYDSMVEVLNSHTEQFQNIFLEWLNHMKDQLSEDAAGHLQQEIDALETPDFDDTGEVEGIGSFTDFMSSFVKGTSIYQLLAKLKAGLKYVLHVDQLVNDCDTDDPELPLAASQGKALKDLIKQILSSLGGLKFKVVTQTEYDALEEKESDMAYFIIVG